MLAVCEIYCHVEGMQCGGTICYELRSGYACEYGIEERVPLGSYLIKYPYVDLRECDDDQRDHIFQARELYEIIGCGICSGHGELRCLRLPTRGRFSACRRWSPTAATMIRRR